MLTFVITANLIPFYLMRECATTRPAPRVDVSLLKLSDHIKLPDLRQSLRICLVAQ
jgi:hypothetical protein